MMDDSQDEDDGGTVEQFERMNASLDNDTVDTGAISDLVGRPFLLGFSDVGDGACDNEPDRVSDSLHSGYQM